MKLEQWEHLQRSKECSAVLQIHPCLYVSHNENEEEAKKAEQVLKDRVSEQIESFTDYVPAELTKLNAAVIKVSGKYAVLSVSDDPEKAKKIIDKYL